MKFQRERWADVYTEILPLLQNANDLLEPYADTMPLDIDSERYDELDKMDVLHVITVRLHGNLVGHHMIFVSEDLRRKGVKQAQTDNIWVHAEYRNSGLVAWSENYLKELGVEVWAAASREKFDITAMWTEKGFKLLERVFIKKLESLS